MSDWDPVDRVSSRSLRWFLAVLSIVLLALCTVAVMTG